MQQVRIQLTRKPWYRERQDRAAACGTMSQRTPQQVCCAPIRQGLGFRVIWLASADALMHMQSQRCSVRRSGGPTPCHLESTRRASILATPHLGHPIADPLSCLQGQHGAAAGGAWRIGRSRCLHPSKDPIQPPPQSRYVPHASLPSRCRMAQRRAAPWRTGPGAPSACCARHSRHWRRRRKADMCGRCACLSTSKGCCSCASQWLCPCPSRSAARSARGAGVGGGKAPRAVGAHLLKYC